MKDTIHMGFNNHKGFYSFVCMNTFIGRCALLCLSCLVFSNLQAQQSHAVLKKEAEDLVVQEKPAEAIDKYNSLISLFGADSGVYLDRGLAYLSLHDFRKAEKDFFTQATLDSTNADAWFLLGLSCMKQNKVQEALRGFGKAITLDPENADAHYFLGRMHLMQHHFKAAIYDFSHAAGINLSHDDALAYRGWTYAMLGETEKGFRDLSLALTMNPGNKEARYFLSRLLMEKKSFASTIAHLDTLVLQDPWFLPQEMWMNGYPMHRTRLQKHLTTYYKHSKGNLVQARKAHVALILGLDALADKLLASPALKDNHRADIEFARARLLMKAGKEDQALDILSRICNKGQVIHPDALYNKILLLVRKGKHDEACADIRQYRILADSEPAQVALECE